MNISNRINLSLFLALACVSITQGAANTISTQTAVTPQMRPEMADALLQISLRQLTRLDQIAEHVARLISDHKVTTLKNPSSALRICTTIRSFLKEMMDLGHTLEHGDEAIKLNATALILPTAQAIALNYKVAFDGNLKTLNPFGIEEYKKLVEAKNQQLTTDPAQLIVRLTALDTLITKLEKMVENIGLTWYNKLARKIDNHILVPIERNNLGRLLAIGAASFATSWYLIGENGDHLVDVAPGWARPFFNKAQSSWGKPIRRNHDNRPLDDAGNAISEEALRNNLRNDPRYTWRSRMADSFHCVMRNPVALMAVGALGAYAYSAWDEIKEPFVKTAALAWNKLRGGAYEKGKVEDVWDFTPRHKFDKVIGLESVKAEFSVLLEFLKNPESAIRRGLIPAKAYLLTGAPGVGKTFAVEGLCGEIQTITQDANHEFRFMQVDALLYSGRNQE